MLTRILHNLKLKLRGTVVHALLSRVGVVGAAKRVYLRRLLAAGQHAVHFQDRLLRFHIDSATEVQRVDLISAEAPFLARMLEYIQEDDVVFDIGANIGVISVALAASSGKSGVIFHAFEPEPRNAEALRHNVMLNQLQNVVAHEIALSDQTGLVRFAIAGEAGTGTHSLSTGTEGSTIDVEAIRGDEFAARNGTRPTVLKIDVEGAEAKVLRGLHGELASGSVREIFIEIHSDRMLAFGDAAEEMDADLGRLGFETAWQTERGTEVQRHYRRPSVKGSPSRT